MRVRRPPDVGRPCATAAWLQILSASALLSACESAEDRVRTEVVPLAKGEYHGARWGGTQVERFYTVAWKGSPDARDGSPVIVSAEHEEPCSLGTNVASYTTLRPQTASKYVTGSPSPARVTLLEDVDEAGFGTLSFADIDCQRIDLSVPEIDQTFLQYVYEPDHTHQQLAVLDRVGSLIFVDPWAQEQHQVAENVTDFSAFETGEWLVEGGQLVERDLKGNVLSRRGSKVVPGLLLLGGTGDVAYQDQRGIFSLRAGVAKRIAKRGCLYLSGLDSFIPPAIGYYDEPCDTDEITLHLAVGTETYTYGPGIIALTISSGLMLYTTQQDEQTKLWLVDAADPAKPKLVGEYSKFSLDGVTTLPSQSIVVMSREEDRTRTIWQLLRADDSVSLVELTRGLRGWSRSGSALALLYDNGDLILADGSLEHVLLRVSNALNSRFSFIMGGKALGFVYLADVDPDTLLGRLELQFLSGEHSVLDTQVREYEYVYWPERGLVYVAGGDNPGIRFARIDVPCQTTSDAPWACGL